jgi:hypothetical protein
MLNNKRISKKGPHKPSNSKRVRNTYLDKPEDKHKNKPKLAAMIFDESVDFSIDEGIGNYFRAFWKGLTGEVYGDLSSFIDPNIDPKTKAFIKAMKEPLTIQEQWMVNNNIMPKSEIMKYREMKTFETLYSHDIKNSAPHVLPGAKEKLNYINQLLPAFRAKYEAGVEAANRALGIDDSRYRYRNYYQPSTVVVASRDSDSKTDSETVDVEGHKDSIERKRNALLARITKIKDGLQSAYQEIIDNDIKIQDRRKIKIEHLIQEGDKVIKEIETLSEDDFRKLLPVKYGTVYKKGPWRYYIDIAANELTRINNFLSNH